MKKKILIFLLVFLALFFAAMAYINTSILPAKIKALLTKELGELTRRTVVIQEMKFNVFKGLVVKNLAFYAGSELSFKIEEASCIPLVWPLFNKQIIIPSLVIDKAEVFLTRDAQGSFDCADIFSSPRRPNGKEGLALLVTKVVLKNSILNARDETVSPPFSKRAEDIQAKVALALPARINFSFNCLLAGEKPARVEMSGQWTLSQKALSGEIRLWDISPRDYLAYYKESGFSVLDGAMDTRLVFKGDAQGVGADLTAQAKDLYVSKDTLLATLDSNLTGNFTYNPLARDFDYSLACDISDLDVKGLKYVQTISDISGKIYLDKFSLSAKELNLTILDTPFKARIEVPDLSAAAFKAKLTTLQPFNYLQRVINERFKLDIPGDIQGAGRLLISLEGRLPLSEDVLVEGFIETENAAFSLPSWNIPIEHIKGRLEFTPRAMRWSGLSFKYRDKEYKTNGMLKNFQLPLVQLQFGARDLAGELSVIFKDTGIKLLPSVARFNNSRLTLEGELENKDINSLGQLKGEADFDCKDIAAFWPQAESFARAHRPEGKIGAKFTIDGRLIDAASCNIRAQFSSPAISLYGLKGSEFFANYAQEDKIGGFDFFHLSLYEGQIEGKAMINLGVPSLPYWVELDSKGVRLKQLIMDADVKEKDIAGILSAQIKISGYNRDLSKLSGAGELLVEYGRLWKLDLFEGLGEVVFGKDFANIVFDSAALGFTIRDKYVFSDNVKFKSDFVNLAGAGRIGFDGIIDASLNVEVLDEQAPLTGSFKDVTTAIIGQAGRFGVIKITGTLEKPEYKFKAAVGDILKSLKDTFLGNIFK